MVVTEEEFKAYETVRQSGITNMYSVLMVVNLTIVTPELKGLSKEKVVEIMESYESLMEKWGHYRKDPDVAALAAEMYEEHGQRG